MNIKKMLASTLAVITMASGATALTSHAEDFTEVAEVEEMTLSALVAEQLEEKEIAGEISAEDVATTIRVAKQVEEMRNQDMISDEDVLEWEQALTGNYDMNAIATYASGENCYPSYNYYETSRLCGTKHYFAILNAYPMTFNSSITVTYCMHSELSGGSYQYNVLNHSIVSSSISSDSIVARTEKLGTTSTSSVGTFSSLMRYQIPLFTGITIAGLNSEDALHRYTSYDINNPSDRIDWKSGDGKNYNPVKCVYALGDVDRSGFVEPKDTLDIIKNIQHVLFEASTNSTTVASSYNEAAFNLAADVNLDKSVDMKDVEEINKFIMGQSS
ncbi:MAG: hypothetical protein K2O52_04840, partial [Oscillospiraceae bacterium]|nr:hypothetical protein [Oscillospiraceae bacterium]